MVTLVAGLGCGVCWWLLSCAGYEFAVYYDFVVVSVLVVWAMFGDELLLLGDACVMLVWLLVVGLDCCLICFVVGYVCFGF